ncbi:MAG: nodulation protein NfeD, partial [candidate division Zixibacteria bacterium]|nr:nodulation protein NfeD [candidate division Zixibacteria bacterium]
MKLRALFLFLIPILFLASLAFSNSNFVYLVTIDGAIGPVTSRIITDAIQTSVRDGAEALVIELNTPGGLDESMRIITRGILNAGVPVIVYVAPSGSRAASAGVFITMSAHIAAMSPGTNIGAAHPVNIGGQTDSTMLGKVENDAAAYIKSIAERRKRNEKWAEDAVRKSVSITEREALELKVIYLIAENINELLAKCDGRIVQLPSGEKILHTKDAAKRNININWRDRILQVITDPNIAYILFSLGM